METEDGYESTLRNGYISPAVNWRWQMDFLVRYLYMHQKHSEE